MNAYLHQFVRTKSVNFSVSEEPTEFLLKSLKEAEEDRKKGFVSPGFDNVDDALAWVKNPKRKYANQI